MPDPLLPDLPPALETLTLSLYPDPELARRALLAPWPFLGGRSAYEERLLWAEGAILGAAQVTRRQSYEQTLRTEREPFQRVDQPYFVGPFTTGTVRSPYPGLLSDSEFWLYMTLYGSEETTRSSLEERLVPGLGWQTTIAYLRAAAQPSFLKRLLARFGRRSKEDPHAEAWFAQVDILYPNFS